MKAILTFSLVLFFSGILFAQNTDNNQKPETSRTEASVVLKSEKIDVFKKERELNNNEIARLYRHKNSRVKRALFFTTKKDKPKLA